MTKLKSNLGEKLVAIREKAIANGMKLKSAEEITGGGGTMKYKRQLNFAVFVLCLVGIITGVVQPDIGGLIFTLLVLIFWRLRA